jgi:hypothetical protein
MDELKADILVGLARMASTYRAMRRECRRGRGLVTGLGLLFGRFDRCRAVFNRFRELPVQDEPD